MTVSNHNSLSVSPAPPDRRRRRRRNFCRTADRRPRARAKLYCRRDRPTARVSRKKRDRYRVTRASPKVLVDPPSEPSAAFRVGPVVTSSCVLPRKLITASVRRRPDVRPIAARGTFGVRSGEIPSDTVGRDRLGGGGFETPMFRQPERCDFRC